MEKVAMIFLTYSRAACSSQSDESLLWLLWVCWLLWGWKVLPLANRLQLTIEYPEGKKIIT